MFSKIKQTYYKSLRTGLQADASFKETLRVELSNQFILMGLFVTGLHAIVNMIFVRSMADLYITFVWFSILGISLLLNVWQKTFQSRFFLVFASSFAVFSLHLLFGPELKMESMYILFLVTATLFFDHKLLIKTVVFILSSFLIAVAICKFNPSPFEDYVNPGGAYTRFIFSVVMISTLIGKLILENREYHSIISSQLEEMKKMNQELKSFNYILSHDLKEPIRSIVSFSQLIKKNINEDKPTKNEYLVQVINSGKQLNDLLNDIANFMESKDKELTKEIFKIDELVEEVKVSLSESLKEKKVQIHCQNFPAIKASRFAVNLILENLLENAIKYNDKQNPSIKIHGEITAGLAKIKVSDNGIGIEKEYFEEVLLLFKRLNTNFTKGSGLGLNIVQTLLKRMKGEISILHSEPKQGTTIQITFPVEKIPALRQTSHILPFPIQN